MSVYLPFFVPKYSPNLASGMFLFLHFGFLANFLQAKSPAPLVPTCTQVTSWATYQHTLRYSYLPDDS